ncbi:MAG: hypothetical protein ABI836_09720 [Gemmatimonadota bacterium]
MASNIRITLTPEQREQIKKTLNRDVEALELSPQDLEERIAPMTAAGWASRHPL